LFESPKSLLCLTLGKENLALSEEKRIIDRTERFGLELGESQGGDEE